MRRLSAFHPILLVTILTSCPVIHCARTLQQGCSAPPGYNYWAVRDPGAASSDVLKCYTTPTSLSDLAAACNGDMQCVAFSVLAATKASTNTACLYRAMAVTSVSQATSTPSASCLGVYMKAINMGFPTDPLFNNFFSPIPGTLTTTAPVTNPQSTSTSTASASATASAAASTSASTATAPAPATSAANDTAPVPAAANITGPAVANSTATTVAAGAAAGGLAQQPTTGVQQPDTSSTLDGSGAADAILSGSAPSGDAPHTRHDNQTVILAAVIPGCAVLMLAAAVFVWHKRRHVSRAQQTTETAAFFLEQDPPVSKSDRVYAQPGALVVCLENIETRELKKPKTSGSQAAGETTTSSRIHCNVGGSARYVAPLYSATTVTTTQPGNLTASASGITRSMPQQLNTSRASAGSAGSAYPQPQSYRASSAERTHLMDMTIELRERRLHSVNIAWDSLSIFQDQVLGYGGFGAVYGGMWMNAEPVAVKMLHPSRLRPEVLDALRQEAFIMTDIPNPYVARVYGLVDDGANHALVMRWYKRGPVSALISRTEYQELPLLERIKIAHQVACGMCSLHGRKPNPIIHGDLKTSNLLIENDGNSVVIADFGLAACLRRGQLGHVVESGAMTLTISPPEVLDNPMAPRTTAGDVYAFGITLLEIVTGKPAYLGISREQLKHLVLTGGRPQMSIYVPVEIASLIRDCWAQHPADRPTFTDVFAVLDAFLQQLRQEGGTSTGGSARLSDISNTVTTTTTPW